MGKVESEKLQDQKNQKTHVNEPPQSSTPPLPTGQGGERTRTRILIVHQNFPGQFLHLAQHLAQRPDVEVVGLGRDTAPGLPNFHWYKYKLHRSGHAHTHPYMRQMENAVLHGQAVARALTTLKAKGFTPDIILSHPGWGETLYAKEIFPAVQLIHLCEWYYSTENADFGFDPEFQSDLNDRLRITTWNALHLLNLQNCDEAIAPTHWQKQQHPASFHPKIRVIHEGIDLAHLGPDPQARITLKKTDSPTSPTSSSQEIVLRPGDPVITYVARNLEPYRGFHTFMRALPAVLTAHPHAHILIVGGDSSSYGALPKDAPNWREKMLQELGPQLQGHLPRIHFLGKIPYGLYKQILQVSALHVYLTYPFVLSWSLLEAMATGCRILASDTAPVREVIQPGINGELVDFFDTEAISRQMMNALNTPQSGQAQRDAARQSARAYGIEQGIAAYEALMHLPPPSHPTPKPTKHE